jgi:hypothetical protein
MKHLIIFSIILLLFTLPAAAQTTCTRHTEPAGRFSYCPPAGWAPKDSASGGPYKTFTTPQGTTITANFNVKDEATTISNAEYMALALKLLLSGNEARGVDARKIIGWTDFTTDTNIKGSRMVYEMLYKGMQMRTVQYVLDLPGKKLLLTGTTLEQNKDTTDKIFDALAKTIKLTP